jgi:hypothetical protein
MGNSILRGISAALFVTVITLIAGMLWTAMGLGGLTMSTLVDIGLIASCLTAGYRTGRDSGQWILGGVAGFGYVTLCITILALFLEVSGWGVVQVLAEGGLIGILAGAFGAGSIDGKNRPAGSWKSSGRFSSWGERYNQDLHGPGSYDAWNSHVEEWNDQEPRSKTSRDKSDWDEEIQWQQEKPSQKNSRWEELNELNEEENLKGKTEDDEWENWVQEGKRKSFTTSASSSRSSSTSSSPSSSYRKAWWEEDVL